MKNKEIEKNLVKLYLLNILSNAIPLACFTTLAIIFNHWWIILISMLYYRGFNFSIDTDKKGDE